MGAANDFIIAFFKEFPEAREGKLTLQELNDRMAGFQAKANQQPVGDFDELNATQMHNLLYAPLTNDCILQTTPSAGSYVSQAPMFRLVELLLAEVMKPGGLKLTVNGNLPIRVCQLLFGEQLVHYKYMEFVTTISEESIPYLAPLKECLIALRIVKKKKNTLTITKEGTQFLREPVPVRFRRLLLYFGHYFAWAKFGYPSYNDHCGQLGWAFSLVLLQKYGAVPREAGFYGRKLIKAFEKGLSDKAAEEYQYAYEHRFFECFASWFGLVHLEWEKGESFHDKLIVSKSELVDNIFLQKK